LAGWDRSTHRLLEESEARRLVALVGRAHPEVRVIDLGERYAPQPVADSPSVTRLSSRILTIYLRSEQDSSFRYEAAIELCPSPSVGR